MPIYPQNYSSGSLEALLITAPVVFLLCWLFNAHRLGKFKKKKVAVPRTSIEKNQNQGLVILSGIVIGCLIGLIIRFVF